MKKKVLQKPQAFFFIQIFPSPSKRQEGVCGNFSSNQFHLKILIDAIQSRNFSMILLLFLCLSIRQEFVQWRKIHVWSINCHKERQEDLVITSFGSLEIPPQTRFVALRVCLSYDPKFTRFFYKHFYLLENQKRLLKCYLYKNHDKLFSYHKNKKST